MTPEMCRQTSGLHFTNF